MRGWSKTLSTLSEVTFNYKKTAQWASAPNGPGVRRADLRTHGRKDTKFFRQNQVIF